VRDPVRALLRCLRRNSDGDFRLPRLTVEDAWRLTEFLDQIQEAIWMDYGPEITAYLDSGQDTESVLPPGAVAQWDPPPGAKDDETMDF